ncbi:hypothetical protein [Serratia plymuthica]|uniref:Uncharacterized protein n=1 Tax=Serratia plymuthica TaxID=82996 RepID=A0A7T2WE15_SERPL|nr:hypothetical protein [Serratia plymuthica]QPS23128.1 hypothetical protein I6G64_12525 [Serratia plymuthica]QPS56017.1 hypothetical protein I6G53_00235 [Serratia plymuthica]QPS64736.1 hypothetical protein I6G52_08320 [Serratia plymuthica]RKS62825.1 hypothetical protein C8E17_2034 [Serratia plymuthica]CAI1711906.1 Uncharacterised protein [Serratia plymuthica]
MKKILILSTVSLGLLAMANATAADGLQRSKQSSGSTDNILLWSHYDQGYIISNYDLGDLDGFKEQLRLQEQAIKKLQDKLSNMESENRNQNSEIDNLKRKLQGQDNAQSEISDLKRSVQDLNNKIK